MAIEKIVIEPNRAWALWKITESEKELSERNSFQETIPETITNPQKRMEWYAVRALTASLMEKMGLAYQGIRKDEYGKPYPKGYTLELSLSHSYPYVAAIIDRHQPVGIDLEQPKEKLLRIAPRILHPLELENCGSDIIKHCIYWCAKEALVKIHGKKDLIFSENLLIEPFARKNEGHITGRIIVKDTHMLIPLYYQINSNFVLVFNNRS